jgi:hypothetical protein
MTILEDDLARLQQHLFDGSSVERAGYLLCRQSVTSQETRLLVRDFFPVEDVDVKKATASEMSIDRQSYVRAMQRADRDRSGLVFVHSHPLGPSGHSSRDDEELPKLFDACRVRIHHEVLHVSIVFANENTFEARVWLPDGSFEPVILVRVIGNRFRFFFLDDDRVPIPAAFDRQVRAFGKDIQKLLSRLNVGVVGYGGTGSCVGEQLIRLGIGKITVCDPDKVTETNLTRIYASTNIDRGHVKVSIAERLATEVALGTKINAIPLSVTHESAALALRDCDIVFCCTDDQWGRSILAKLASYYLIPVIDMGVKVPSVNGKLGTITGRVNVLMPGSACVFCTGRVTAEGVAAQCEAEMNPQLAEQRRAEGYAPELNDPDPSVIFLTSTVATGAVTELFARFTGFAGEERPGELLYRFSETKLSRVARQPKPDCFCGDRKFWARGDASPMLDLTWRGAE